MHAARSGHLRVLQWAREHNCPWDSNTCCHAARAGQLVLHSARENDCPWDWWACTYAAMDGQLEVLQWMRENDTTGEVWVARACPRRWAQEAGGADMAGWTQCAVKSIQRIHALRVQGTASVSPDKRRKWK